MTNQTFQSSWKAINDKVLEHLREGGLIYNMDPPSLWPITATNVVLTYRLFMADEGDGYINMMTRRANDELATALAILAYETRSNAVLMEVEDILAEFNKSYEEALDIPLAGHLK